MDPPSEASTAADYDYIAAPSPVLHSLQPAAPHNPPGDGAAAAAAAAASFAQSQDDLVYFDPDLSLVFSAPSGLSFSLTPVVPPAEQLNLPALLSGQKRKAKGDDGGSSLVRNVRIGRSV